MPEESIERKDNRAVESHIIFFVSVLTIILGVTYWLARFGFDNNSFLKILMVIGVSFFLTFFPDIGQPIVKRFNCSNAFCSKPAFLLYGLVLLIIFGLLTSFFNAGIIFTFLGFIFFFILLIKLFKTSNAKAILITVFFGAVFSLWTIGVIWGFGYHSPLLLEKIILGIAHIDTLFISDVSNMIRTYGIPSTGLDGLPYLNYHWGSYFIFAQLSKILKLNGIDFYNLAYPVIFIPFLLKSLLTFVVELQKKMGLVIVSYYKLWLVLFLGFAGIFSSLFLSKNGLYIQNNIISESYLVAISLILILMGLAITYWQKTKKKWTLTDFIFLVLFVPIFLGVIGIVKISLLYLALGAFAYLFLRLRLYTQTRYIVSFLLSVTIGMIIYKLVSIEGNFPVYLFHFVKNRVDPDLRNYFWLLYYFMAWIFIYLRLKDIKIKTTGDLKQAFLSQKIIDIEILIVFSVLGFLPGAIMDIGGGSATYFSDFQYLFALALLLAYLPRFWPDSKKAKHKFNINNFSLKKIFLVILAIPIILSAYANTYDLLRQFVIEDISIRVSLLPEDSTWKREGHLEYFKNLLQKDNSDFLKAIIDTASEPQKTLNNSGSGEYQTAKLLYNLGSDPSVDKKRTAIFIPQDNYLFWNMLTYKCIQFVAPALSSMAMISGIEPFVQEKVKETDMQIITQNLEPADKQIVYQSFLKTQSLINRNGEDLTLNIYALKKDLNTEERIRLYNILSPANFELLKDYGYSSYDVRPNESEYIMISKDDKSICRQAKLKGFQKVIILREENKQPILSSVDCGY